jgi:hypothetical protein
MLRFVLTARRSSRPEDKSFAVATAISSQSQSQSPANVNAYSHGISCDRESGELPLVSAWKPISQRPSVHLSTDSRPLRRRRLDSADCNGLSPRPHVRARLRWPESAFAVFKSATVILSRFDACQNLLTDLIERGLAVDSSGLALSGVRLGIRCNPSRIPSSDVS